MLDETHTQIRTLGMAAVRVADAAEATGVSPALIIYHFGTKENLLSAALLRAGSLHFGRHCRRRSRRRRRAVLHHPRQPAADPGGPGRGGRQPALLTTVFDLSRDSGHSLRRSALALTTRQLAAVDGLAG
ncbi:helix-turn-helix domain-containing protein [Kutzneria buriramensis]|uniref:helix-turn-helix domain-containing protein n=1 Tax=Kutzneria buriramensis TaxID=1045776 RepID=UPI000E22F447|nr:helix-turn-helix domain-containing protein [Kutzneria buriramensis]